MNANSTQMSVNDQSVHLLVADGGIDLMNVGGEWFEFDLLRILDEMRIRQIPTLGDVQVFISVNQKIESASRLKQDRKIKPIDQSP